MGISGRKVYSLKIPFKLNANNSIKSDENKIDFKLDGYDIKFCLNDNHQKGEFVITFFEDKAEIWPFYTLFKKTIDILNLSPDLWSIKLINLEKDNIMRYVNEKCISEELTGDNVIVCKFSGGYTINESFKVGLIQLNPIDEIINKISMNFCCLKSINWENNKKLSAALDIYTNSYFQEDTARFLSYSIILELLKPVIEREGIGLKCVNELKSKIAEYQVSDKVSTNDNLINEFKSLNNSVKNLEYMSISYSIKQIPDSYNIELENYDDLPMMLGKCYSVRSKFVHNGSIHKNFDECFVFLREFIPILLMNAIDFYLK